MGRTLWGMLGHRDGSDARVAGYAELHGLCLLCGVRGMLPLQSILHLQGVCRQPWSQTALRGLYHL